jgi:hypothetical protein
VKDSLDCQTPKLRRSHGSLTLPLVRYTVIVPSLAALQVTSVLATNAVEA